MFSVYNFPNLKTHVTHSWTWPIILKLSRESNFTMPDMRSSWTIKYIQNMCPLHHKLFFLKEVDMYDMSLPPIEMMMATTMLWHGFPLMTTKEMA